MDIEKQEFREKNSNKFKNSGKSWREIEKLLEHPYRIFFILCAVAVFVAVLPWLTLYFAPEKSGVYPLHWHAFTFLNFFGGAAFLGFLFTAFPEWSQRITLKYHTVIFSVLWLVMLFSLQLPMFTNWLAVVMWLYLSVFIAYWVLKTKKWALKNFAFLLFFITFFSVIYSIKQRGIYLHSMVDVFLMGVTMVNFRVGNVLGNEALRDWKLDDKLSFRGNIFYKDVVVICIGIYTISASAGISPAIISWLAFSTAMACAARLHEWHEYILLRAYYVRGNYGVNLVMFLGYFGVGLSYFFPKLYSPSRHFLSIGAMISMVLIIMSIAGTRHSGLKLAWHLENRFAIGLVFIAAICRSFGSIYFPSLLTIYVIPSFCLIIAFILYAIRYLIIFKKTDPV